jgi:hypothetical protein
MDKLFTLMDHIDNVYSVYQQSANFTMAYLEKGSEKCYLENAQTIIANGAITIIMPIKNGNLANIHTNKIMPSIV